VLLPLVNTPLIEYTLEWLALNKVEEVSTKREAALGSWMGTGGAIHTAAPPSHHMHHTHHTHHMHDHPPDLRVLLRARGSDQKVPGRLKVAQAAQPPHHHGALR